MRRTHKVPLLVKAANLAKYFPAWTVTRNQWSDMLMPCISGMEIDTLLFSHVGLPLCHRYQLMKSCGPSSACLGPSCSGREIYRQSGMWTYSISGGSQDCVSARRPRLIKGVEVRLESSEHPTAEVSSVQLLMELALPRLAMMEGPCRLRLSRRRRRHRVRSSRTGERTPAVRWTRHRFRLLPKFGRTYIILERGVTGC